MHEWSMRTSPQLAVLVELVAHGGHITRAAAALDIPQSSMSRRIRALEHQLGVPLIVPDGRGVRLTPRAVDLARAIRDPLRQIDSAICDVTGDADPDHGTVRFGFPLTMGSGLLPDLLAEFGHRHPGIGLLLRQAHGSSLASDLLAGHLDLAVVIPGQDRLAHVRIGTQRIGVVLPDDHRLAGSREVRLADLRDEAFVANPVDYNLRRLTDTWCGDAGFTPDVVIEVTEFATIRALVSRGLGVALLPSDADGPTTVVEKPLVGEGHSRDITLAWGSPTLSAPTRRLKAFLLEGFERNAAQ